jgi:SOS response regulatory protein OraA/RecX
MGSATDNNNQPRHRDREPPLTRTVESMLHAKKLRPEEREAVERICAQWASLDDILDAAAGPREPIGELLVEAGRLTRAQLTRALAEQQSSKERLGQVLVRKGWLSEGELAALLAFQERLDAGRAGPLQLGNLLVSTGRITSEQLQDGIERQARSRQRLGEALVAAGAVSERDIARGLKLQRILVGIALAAAFALSATPKPARAASSGFGSSTMKVTANVLPYLRLQVLKQVSTLDVTPEDVARGYIDVPAATDLMAKTNDRNGFSLSFDARSNVFRKAQVTGLVSGLELGPDGGMAHQPFTGNQMLMRLSYRFFLAPEVAPGSYPWPLQISSTVMY